MPSIAFAAELLKFLIMSSIHLYFMDRLEMRLLSLVTVAELPFENGRDLVGWMSANYLNYTKS